MDPPASGSGYRISVPEHAGRSKILMGCPELMDVLFRI
jgi:hypothetical protein